MDTAFGWINEVQGATIMKPEKNIKLIKKKRILKWVDMTSSTAKMYLTWKSLTIFTWNEPQTLSNITVTQHSTYQNQIKSKYICWNLRQVCFKCINVCCTFSLRNSVQNLKLSKNNDFIFCKIISGWTKIQIKCNCQHYNYELCGFGCPHSLKRESTRLWKIIKRALV